MAGSQPNEQLMKALVYTGPHSLAFRDEPDAVPRNDEVVVKVDAVGICGSDMHAYHGHDSRRPAPLILGHEAAGIAMSGRLQGRRVTVNPLVTCGACAFCLDGRSHLCSSRQIISMMPRPGAFAELVCIPEQNLVEVPDGFDIVKAALAEPVAVSYHAVQLGLKASPRPATSMTAAVLGGGAIGLAAALVLAMSGCSRIHVAEPNAARRATVARSGPFDAYEPGAAREPNDASVDLVIDAVGADKTREAACRLVKPGGVIVHIGLLPGSGGVDVRKLTLQEVTFLGSYCYTMVDFRETVAALADGKLGPLDWVEERALRDGAAAFKAIDEGKTAAAKIILRPAS
jgi:threonine dehydrogenase-like Zn-dependent dehydrogenase